MPTRREIALVAQDDFCALEPPLPLSLLVDTVESEVDHGDQEVHRHDGHQNGEAHKDKLGVHREGGFFEIPFARLADGGREEHHELGVAVCALEGLRGLEVHIGESMGRNLDLRERVT